MGFRFHKSIKLIPGIRLNLSKGVPSVSVGEKGFTYNIGEKGEKSTFSLPGTGMSYSTKKNKSTPVIVIILMAGGALLFKYLPQLIGK